MLHAPFMYSCPLTELLQRDRSPSAHGTPGVQPLRSSKTLNFQLMENYVDCLVAQPDSRNSFESGPVQKDATQPQNSQGRMGASIFKARILNASCRFLLLACHTLQLSSVAPDSPPF